MFTRADIHPGMKVRSSDRKRLGLVIGCDEETFIVEKKLLSRVDYVARYGDVATVTGEEVILSRARGEITSVRSDAVAGGSRATYGDEGGGGRFLW